MLLATYRNGFLWLIESEARVFVLIVCKIIDLAFSLFFFPHSLSCRCSFWRFGVKYLQNWFVDFSLLVFKQVKLWIEAGDILWARLTDDTPHSIRKSQQVINTIGGLSKGGIHFFVVFSSNISHNNSFVFTSEVFCVLFYAHINGDLRLVL